MCKKSYALIAEQENMPISLIAIRRCVLIFTAATERNALCIGG